MERFWCLSTLILDLGREHISAAYMTGEFWHSTDREAIRILTETAKLEPFRRFWKALTDDDFIAWMVGALVPGSNWNFAKAGVLQDPFSLYFAVCLSRYVSLIPIISRILCNYILTSGTALSLTNGSPDGRHEGHY